MRFTRYGESSDKEIDALRIPPTCECGNPVEDYDETCEECLADPDQDGREAVFEAETSDVFKS